MTKRRSRKLVTVLFLAALLWSSQAAAQSAKETPDSNQELDEMSIYHLPAVWETSAGTTLNLSDLKGQVIVAVMVYTACKAACPILIGEMKNIEARVKERTSEEVRYVLVSIDPKGDTPERLRKVRQEYGLNGEQWILMRGTEETTRDFANILAVKYKQISPIDFSHSNIISVFDRNGVLRHQREGVNVDSKETIEKIIELALTSSPK